MPHFEVSVENPLGARRAPSVEPAALLRGFTTSDFHFFLFIYLFIS